MNETNNRIKELCIFLHPANTAIQFKLTRSCAYLDDEILHFNGDICFNEEKIKYCSIRVIINVCNKDNDILQRVRAKIEGLNAGDSILSFGNEQDMCGRGIVRLNDHTLRHLHHLEVCVLFEVNDF